MQKAFTLIELIIVAIIVTILASVAIVQYKNVIEKSRSAEAYAVLADIAASESAYYSEYNAYTATWANLDRFDAAPSGQNFSFSTALDNVVASGYVKAIFIPGKGTTSYYMCVNGGTKGTSPPSCP